MLETWGEITAHFASVAGVEISVRTAKRWADLYGLPIQKRGPSSRGRVLANPARLDAWWTTFLRSPSRH
jgi:hypothetical protein